MSEILPGQPITVHPPTKPLLVIAPAVKLSHATLGRIEDAGYIVVRGTTADFALLGPTPALEPLVLQAALDAIGEHKPTSDTNNGNGVRNLFARKLVGALGYRDKVAMK